MTCNLKKKQKKTYISFVGLCKIDHKGATNCNDYIFSGQCFSGQHRKFEEEFESRD